MGSEFWSLAGMVISCLTSSSAQSSLSGHGGKGQEGEGGFWKEGESKLIKKDV